MEILRNFLQIKKVIALLLTVIFCVLSVKGSVTSSEFLTVFSMVISFYFGQSTARQTMKETKSDIGE